MTNVRRFLVEVFVFVTCLLVGAAVFQALEYREDIHPETNSSKILVSVVKNISQKYNISARDMNYTVMQLRRRILKRERDKWENWDFTGCYFFAGTVAFTIGFGHQAPKTSLGQFMVIIYAMIAIPITGLMLSACGERLAEKQQNAVIFIERKIFKREPSHLKAKTITMNVLVLVLFLIGGSLMTKYYYDGWTIIEGIYFLWICLTTVGFGDYVINNGKPYYEDNITKTLMLRFNIIMLVIGLCQVSCILVSIQNALEDKFVQKVGNEESNDKSDVKNEREANGQTNNEETGKDSVVCELEIIEDEESNVSVISSNT